MKTTALFLFLSAILITSYGQSRFGVHLGSLTYPAAANYINQLGPQIYVRNEFFRDEFGWRHVKDAGLIADCQQYCDSSMSPDTCACGVGSFYYRSPANRDGLLTTPTLSDFYNSVFNQFVNFYTSRYDSIPPTNPSDLIAAYPYGAENIYGDYVSFIVQNFSNKVKYWEIGNENNLLQFWAGTELEYANMVAIASEKIRQNCTGCKVGISFSHPDIAATQLEKQKWYSAMNTVLDTFDFIDAHFCTATAFIQIGQLDSLKNHFPGKEIISTETGLPDSIVKPGQTIGGTLVKQAQDLAKFNTFMFDEGYSKIYWYLIDVDYGSGPIFLHNALINEDYSIKPAFYSYKTMISKVDSFTSITQLAEGQYKYFFANKNPVYILWCDSGTCAIPSEISGTVKVTDYMGNETLKDASLIVLDSIPVYVEAGVNAINENTILQNKISVYPNPFSSLTTLQAQDLLNDATLTVYNFLGQTVKHIDNLSGWTIILNRDNLPGGLYFIRLTQGSKVIATKTLLITD